MPHFVVGQLSSSSPFLQSGNPSQTYDFEMQRPESHINCVRKQMNGASSVGDKSGVGVDVLLEQPNSSESSPQSFTPSHFHQFGTHLLFLQWNIQSWQVGIILSIFEGGSVAVVLQCSSSKPFKQSLSPSK